MNKYFYTFSAFIQILYILLFSKLSFSLTVPNYDPIPRTILALYDSKSFDDIIKTKIHRIAEMPLNYLGLIVQFHDISKGLPKIEKMNNVRGVLTWFESDVMADPINYIKWLEKVIQNGKKIVVFGDPGISYDLKNKQTPIKTINNFLKNLGIRSEDDWIRLTYNVNLVYKDPEMVEFERSYPAILSPYNKMLKIDKRAKSFLVARYDNNPNADNPLVITSPNGGYAAGGYIYFYDKNSYALKWYINLFKFFKNAYNTEDLPKADVSTLSGRRIFYSQIDGDGWRNVSEIKGYKESRILSAEVILNEVIKPFSDLPVTVAPIVADINPNWYGTPNSLQIAKTILAMPHVEAASHTYTHPIEWSFFTEYSIEKEKQRVWEYTKNNKEKNNLEYNIPRSYYLKPFNLDQEIKESINFINSILIPHKKVETFQWSGDTLPFEKAIEATRNLNVRNINGGDTRFDREYPSYSWVAPISRQVGHQRQIYASNSNENTYTDSWKDHFFGFQHLIRTIQNTETPWRIKPFNIYYHMYSGEKFSSLNAVLNNLKYARSQKLIPIPTSNYAAIADGFFTTQIFQTGKQQWRIKNRGSLQTIRFDNGTFMEVDFSRSTGVLGQQQYQGSLYVALDAARSSPVITLSKNTELFMPPKSPYPYLIESSWKIWDLILTDSGFKFKAQGFGQGKMLWKVPQTLKYDIEIKKNNKHHLKRLVSSGKDGTLSIILDAIAIDPVQVFVRYYFKNKNQSVKKL